MIGVVNAVMNGSRTAENFGGNFRIELTSRYKLYWLAKFNIYTYRLLPRGGLHIVPTLEG